MRPYEEYVRFTTDDLDMSVTRLGGRLRCRSDGSGCSKHGGRNGPDDDNISCPPVVSEYVENPVQSDHPVHLAFPAIGHGGADSRETAGKVHAFHCVHDHAKKFLVKDL